jgi:hypothetical protein
MTGRTWHTVAEYMLVGVTGGTRPQVLDKPGNFTDATFGAWYVSPEPFHGFYWVLCPWHYNAQVAPEFVYAAAATKEEAEDLAVTIAVELALS